MPINEPQVTESQEPSRDRELYEKSMELRTYSHALLSESRDLCLFSRKLRAINEVLAVNNVNPNAARKRESLRKAALRFASRPPEGCLSFDIRLSDPSPPDMLNDEP